MTNTPMTFEQWWNDLFKHLQNDSVWSRDELHNLATMSWQASQAQQASVIAELVEALDEAKAHLEYCGYGDSWERECAEAQGLPAKLETVLTKAKGK